MKLIRFITIFFIAQLNISVFSDNIKIRENQINIDFIDFFNFYHLRFFSCVRVLKNCVRENKKQQIFS